MVVSDAINKSLEDIEKRYESENDEKKKKQLILFLPYNYLSKSTNSYLIVPNPISSAYSVI